MTIIMIIMITDMFVYQMWTHLSHALPRRRLKDVEGGGPARRRAHRGVEDDGVPP